MAKPVFFRIGWPENLAAERLVFQSCLGRSSFAMVQSSHSMPMLRVGHRSGSMGMASGLPPYQ